MRSFGAVGLLSARTIIGTAVLLDVVKRTSMLLSGLSF